MSLIIVKINKQAQTQSIWYDGIMTSRAILAIDGNICVMEIYAKSTIGAHVLFGEETYAIGQCEGGSRAMLTTGKLTPEEIIEAVAKVNCKVNSNIRSIQKIKGYCQ